MCRSSRWMEELLWCWEVVTKHEVRDVLRLLSHGTRTSTDISPPHRESSSSQQSRLLSSVTVPRYRVYRVSRVTTHR